MRYTIASFTGVVCVDRVWSPEGVVTQSYRGSETVCCSRHLSSFAVTRVSRPNFTRNLRAFNSLVHKVAKMVSRIMAER